MKQLLLKLLQSISCEYSLFEVVGQGLAFLRKSHAGCNSPPDCCQEPAFESILRTLLYLHSSRCPLTFTLLEVVGQNGLEPSTSRLSVVCSSQLSYWPIFSFHIFFRYILPVPSKLNNASSLKLYNPCTDLRTLLEDTL